MMPQPSKKRANSTSPPNEIRDSTISSLPSEVLCKIISLLPARDVVRSSILSKQWKNFWLSNVNWRLTSSNYPRRRPRALEEFKDFISHVIYFHTGPGIQKMSINLTNHLFFRWPAVMWMDQLASHHPITDLDLDIGGPVIPPVALFSCSSLISLRLVLHSARLTIPAEVKLSSLKELYLEDVNFAKSSDAQRLINGCTALEMLSFNGCTGDALYDLHLTISLPELRVYNFHSGSEYIYVHIAAMNLEKFTFRGRHLTMSEDVEFPVLKEVRLDEFQWLEHYRAANRGTPTEKSAKKMHNTVSSLEMAEKLWLGQWCIQYLSSMLPEINLPTFENLTSLSIEFWPNKYHANVVLYIIKCSPNLERFYATTCSTTCNDTIEMIYQDEVHLHLKHIEMDSFTGSEVEMRLISRLLGDCLQLRKLNIKFTEKLNQTVRRTVRREVRSIKKLSPALIISVT